jgi:hypothetical protein
MRVCPGGIQNLTLSICVFAHGDCPARSKENGTKHLNSKAVVGARHRSEKHGGASPAFAADRALMNLWNESHEDLLKLPEANGHVCKSAAVLLPALAELPRSGLEHPEEEFNQGHARRPLQLYKSEAGLEPSLKCEGSELACRGVREVFSEGPSNPGGLLLGVLVLREGEAGDDRVHQ